MHANSSNIDLISLVRLILVAHRGDTVKLQTYFTEESKITARRDWLVLDVVSGQQLGCATR